MQNVCRQLALLRPTVSAASGVALVLAFLLATHTFWCGLAGSACESDIAPIGFVTGVAAHTSAAVPVVTPSHFDADICAGMDEAKNRVIAAISPLTAPVLFWIALVFLAATLDLSALFQRAAVFGRDGPVRVPPLHSRLVRASLPHRAPPAFLF